MLQTHIDVAYTIADGRNITLDATFRGGDPMSTCTAGFTARQVTVGSYGQITIGDYGVITAGHCGSELPTDTKPVIMSGVNLPFVYGWLSPTADAQFHKIPVPSSGTHHVSDDYYCGQTYSRFNPYCDVFRTEARANMQGDYVCHTGKNSGISCGEVTRIDYRPKYASCFTSRGVGVDCENVFVTVHGINLRGCGGDSGGPYYRGGIAYGIHSGRVAASDDDCGITGRITIFSAIREVEAFLGVQVLTEPVTLRAS